jgi:8-oxo-dGTP pyrophosphatase MutT (NUDIX family)
VLLRDGDPGLEVLLLRRNSRAGFVPRMYVFPGGRVDASDAEAAAVDVLDGVTHETAAKRLGLHDSHPPAVAYYVAALREAFEETGILVGMGSDGSRPPTAATDPEVDRIRDELMEDRIGFVEALARLECRLSGHALEYFAHWITPRSEPRRFDARFFAARVAPKAQAIVDPREMTEARWLHPARALEEHAAGGLPMIRPTVWALEKLRDFARAEEAIRALADEEVVTILPDG